MFYSTSVSLSYTQSFIPFTLSALCCRPSTLVPTSLFLWVCFFHVVVTSLFYFFRSMYKWYLEKAMAPHSSSLAWKIRAWWAAVHGVAKGRTWLSDFTFTFHFHALEKEIATHSSVLAWRIPGTGEPGWLTSMGSHRVWHNWSNLAAAVAYSQKKRIHTHTHTHTQ